MIRAWLIVTVGAVVSTVKVLVFEFNARVPGRIGGLGSDRMRCCAQC